MACWLSRTELKSQTASYILITLLHRVIELALLFHKAND